MSDKMIEVVYVIAAATLVCTFCRTVWWAINVNPEQKKQYNMKPVITQVAIVNSKIVGSNPIFNCIQVGPADIGGGSFLEIRGEDYDNDGCVMSLEWEEFDKIVEVVAEYRKQWEWTEKDY